MEVRRVDMLHVMSRGHIPATQTNRDSNRDKILSRSDHPKASETYRRGDEIDVFEYEVQFLCWTAASVCALSSHIPGILEVELFFFYTPFGKLCGRTNRSRSHIGGRPHRSFLFFSFLFSCGARFTVKSSFVYPRHNCSPLVGHDVRENSSSCGCVKIRTHVPYRQKVSGATGYRQYFRI